MVGRDRLARWPGRSSGDEEAWAAWCYQCDRWPCRDPAACRREATLRQVLTERFFAPRLPRVVPEPGPATLAARRWVLEAMTDE